MGYSCLETAANEQLSEEERARILHFVIVGGGPTGVEFCAELTDFIEQVAVKHRRSLLMLIVQRGVGTRI